MAFTTIQTTQNEFLLNYLRGTGRTLTEAQARAQFGINNLSARISELRQMGFRVRTSTNTQGRTAYAVSRRDVFGSQAA
jgi:hypothetical protein